MAPMHRALVASLPARSTPPSLVALDGSYDFQTNRAEMGENARAVAAFELARKWNPHIAGIDGEIERLKSLGGDGSAGADPLGCGRPST